MIQDSTSAIAEIAQFLRDQAAKHGTKPVKLGYRQFVIDSRKGLVPTKRKRAVPRPWVRAGYERQGWICSRCRNKIEKFSDATGDHTIALNQGGADEPDNISAMHKHCNSSKGGRTLNEEAKRTGRTVIDQLRAARGIFD